ncbi:MAG: hypothetical protein NTY38_24030, partial [Acidobacteria bacterium]|nr:hypothetical protein [Acidobacteriota bacterium]
DHAGLMWRRNYLFLQHRVRFLGKESIPFSKPSTETGAPALLVPPSPPPQSKSWKERFADWKKNPWRFPQSR